MKILKMTLCVVSLFLTLHSFVYASQPVKNRFEIASDRLSEAVQNTNSRCSALGEQCAQNAPIIICGGATIAVVTGIVCLATLLPTHTLHVKNISPYTMSIACGGSANTLSAGAHGRLYCSSNAIDSVSADAPWQNDVKTGYATQKSAARHHAIFEVDVTSCKRDCMVSTTSGSGKNKHTNTKTYPRTGTWHLIGNVNDVAPTNITAAAWWSQDDSGYVSDVAPTKNLRGWKK